MLELGFSISSEEHPATELVRQAKAAEAAGFSFALISDHFHPWTHKQGNSPFVWSVLGAIAASTDSIKVGTAVTCPTVRIHPGIIAHAAATVAAMMPGRFMLGVGTGENLNEHIFGARWPAPGVRIEMLEEAIEVIQQLWRGGWQNHAGKHYMVENARIFSLPEQPPSILVAASSERSARLAGRLAQGLICTSPNRKTIEAFEDAGGRGKPRYGQLTVCWARNEEEARRTALEIWPNAAITGQATTELPLPLHFEQLARLVKKEDIEGSVVCGPRADRHIEAIREFERAGFDHVFIHQIGYPQAEFADFYRREIIPEFKRTNSQISSPHAEQRA
jgi:coenzyme F420-dependent glucose-6-phosphate dehydrogenase